MCAQLSTQITTVSTTMVGAGDSTPRQEATPTPQLDDAQNQELAFWIRQGAWISSDLPGNVESSKHSAVPQDDLPILEELCHEFGRLRI